MACLISYGYSLPCKAIGGIAAVWIGAWNPGLQYTLDSSAPGPTSSFNTITGFTGATGSFFSFQAQTETASLVEAGAGSTDNNTFFYTQTFEMSVFNLTQAVIEQISLLGKGRWRVIIQDEQGLWWLVGRTNGANVVTSTPGLGKAYGDLNGAIITFEAKDQEPIRQISSAALGVLGIS